MAHPHKEQGIDMKNAESVTFGGSGLDRAAHLRGSDEKLADLLATDGAGVLAIWRGKPLLDLATRTPIWLSNDHSVFSSADEGPIFLGLDEGLARFARDISGWESDEVPDTLGAFHDPSEQRHPDIKTTQAFCELRANMTTLSARDAEMVTMAKAVLSWHETHGFCARCGTKSGIAQAGWQRDCPGCGAHHFPRTDPVVIMLILHGNSVLMGRSPGWPEGMYSLLAGFVEAGETIEAAVRRETLEESGIRVGAVDYLSSQPWPFPSSLMFGCRGVALTREITVDPEELEDALWVTREEMVASLTEENPMIKPARRGSIARFLIENWLADSLD